METLHTFLPVILYIFGIALLIVMIILGIKLIQTVNKTNRLLDDIEKKMNSFNQLFHIVDVVADRFAFVSDRIVDILSGFVRKIFKRKEEKNDE